MKEIGIWERFKLNGRWDDEGIFQKPPTTRLLSGIGGKRIFVTGTERLLMGLGFSRDPGLWVWVSQKPLPLA